MLNRRSTLALLTASAAVPTASFSAAPKTVSWEDLIPKGVPYSEIVEMGDVDYVNDTWNPVFDENATKLNENLNGVLIRMPGFIIPLETGAKGVTEFLMVPYVGACIHTPPPPANQLVLGQTNIPWPNDELWDPVWVTGVMRTQLQSTDLGQTGYAITAQAMEVYQW